MRMLFLVRSLLRLLLLMFSPITTVRVGHRHSAALSLCAHKKTNRAFCRREKEKGQTEKKK